MSEDIYKEIFSKNLKHYMAINGKTQTDLINDLDLNNLQSPLGVTGLDFQEWIKLMLLPNTLELIVLI